MKSYYNFYNFRKVFFGNFSATATTWALTCESLGCLIGLTSVLLKGTPIAYTTLGTFPSPKLGPKLNFDLKSGLI